MTKHNQLVRPKELAAILGVSSQTIWRWRKDNQIPEPIFLGPRMIAWEAKVIEKWLEEKRSRAEILH
jgi:predicted DNA-binding transcriptional regulator AlpA